MRFTSRVAARIAVLAAFLLLVVGAGVGFSASGPISPPPPVSSAPKPPAVQPPAAQVPPSPIPLASGPGGQTSAAPRSQQASPFAAACDKVFDNVLVADHQSAVHSWTHSFDLTGFTAVSAQLQVREDFSDIEASTITIDGDTQSFTPNGFAHAGPPIVQTFNVPLSDLADGQVDVTFAENGDDIALDWSKLVITTTTAPVVDLVGDEDNFGYGGTADPPNAFFDNASGPDIICSGTAAPSVPTLVSPADGSTVGPSPTLTWNASDSATSYDVEVVPEGEGCSFDDASPSNVTDTSFPTDLGDGSYCWRVQAEGDGGPSGYSDPFTFTIIGIPTPLAPDNASTIKGNQATIEWTSIDGATGYDLRLVKGGSESCDPRTVDPTHLDSIDSSTQSYVTDPLDPGHYCWDVQATTDSGASGYDETFEFFVAAAPTDTITSVTDPVNHANQTDASASGTVSDPSASVSVTVTDGSDGSAGPFDATVDGSGTGL